MGAVTWHGDQTISREQFILVVKTGLTQAAKRIPVEGKGCTCPKSLLPRLDAVAIRSFQGSQSLLRWSIYGCITTHHKKGANTTLTSFRLEL